MSNLIHYRCPNCDEQGQAIPDPKTERWVCAKEGCRVRIYAPYFA